MSLTRLAIGLALVTLATFFPHVCADAKEAAPASAEVDKNLKDIEVRLESRKDEELSSESVSKMLAELSKIILDRPQSSTAYCLRGQIYLELKDLKASNADFDQAIKIDPKFAKAYWLRSVNNVFLNRLQEALEDCDSAIANGEKSAGIYMNRGSVEQNLEQDEKAVADLTKALEISKSDGSKRQLWPALLMRANSYSRLNQYQAALADADSLLTLKSVPVKMLPEVHRLKGASLMHLERYKEAVTELTEALSGLKGEGKAKTVFLRAYCHHKLGESELALADRKLARELGFREHGSPPIDRPMHGERGMLDVLIKPHVEQARKTLPEVKARYLKGLPVDQHLSVTTRIYGPGGQMEQVFVGVKSWKNDTIDGVLNSEVSLPNHKVGESLVVLEKDVYDWTIVMPDGSEEGNFVGKFIDSMQK